MDLLGWVREDFGIPLIGAHPTGLGADARAATFRGEAADGSTYAVKTSTAPQPGLVVAQVLAARGVRGVPAPVPARDGRLTALRGDLALSVVPWVGRRRALEGGMEKAHWHGLGRLLAQVHATDTADPALVGLAVERPGADRLVDRARAMPERRDAGATRGGPDVRARWGAGVRPGHRRGAAGLLRGVRHE